MNVYTQKYADSQSAAKLLQSCPTLCDPMDCSLPGFSVPGILQARTLEWVAIFFSNAWKWKVKVKLLSYVWLLVTPWTAAHQAPPSMGFSRQEYWSGVPLPSPSGKRTQLRHKIKSNNIHRLLVFLGFWVWFGSIVIVVVQFLCCVRLCDPMDCSMPGFPVLHYLLNLAQTHVHWAGNAIQSSHPLFPCSPSALNLSQHHPDLFSNESALCIRWPKYWSAASASVLPMNIQGL